MLAGLVKTHIRYRIKHNFWGLLLRFLPFGGVGVGAGVYCYYLIGFKVHPLSRRRCDVKSYEQTIFCLKASVTKLSSAPCQVTQIPYCAAHVRQYFSQFVCNYDSRKSSLGSTHTPHTISGNSQNEIPTWFGFNEICPRQQLSTMQI